MAPVGHVSGFLMVAFSVLLEMFESYPKNRVLISFPSPTEATALLFPRLQEDLSIPSLSIELQRGKLIP